MGAMTSPLEVLENTKGIGGPAWIRTKNQQIMSQKSEFEGKEDKAPESANSSKTRQNPQLRRNKN